MKNKIFLGSIIAIGCFAFCVNQSQAVGPTIINNGTHITSRTVWTKAESPYLIKGYVYVDEELVIEPGAIIKFEYGAGRLEVWNKLTAVGTPEERIIFTSMRDDSFGGDNNNDGGITKPAAGDWSHIMFSTANCDAEIKYASIFYGSRPGIVDGALAINAIDKVSIKNSEIKYSDYSGIFIYNAQPIIESNLISNNRAGILSYSSKVPVVSQNSIVDNSTGVLVTGLTTNRLDARNNWWGSRTGPYHATLNSGGKGKKVGDRVLFDPWLGKDPNHLREPVVLIPGIGGSVNWDVMISDSPSDNWKLMSHTYDGIIAAFKNMGYEEGKDFFVCYYDWRQKNVDSARDFLKPLIAKANTLNGTTKVNIIAHSMGGILARSYIQGDNYINDVDNLIMIGTPNKGASDVYPVWEGGYIPSNWKNKTVFRAYLNFIDTKKLTLSDYQSVHQYIPSVKELMPLYDYIHPKGDSQNLKSYLSMTEINSHLKSLNDNIDLLNQRVKVSVISGNSQQTVNGIPVIERDDETLWIDGKPDPIDPERNDIRGDERVLLSSSEIEGIVGDVLNFDHGDIVDQSAPIIATKLSEEVDKIFDSPVIDNELAFWFASPVDVEIKDPEGKIINKDNMDSPDRIPLAIYSGESKPDGFKFISIPKPKEGDYEINLTGNGTGGFHAGSIYADYVHNISDQESPIEGDIIKDETKKYKLEYSPEDVENPVGDIELADTTPPTITGYVTTQPNANGWYNTDVVVRFEAEDGESGIESVTSDVIVSTEGANQSVTGAATNIAGNVGTYTVSGINIDKNPPNITIISSESKEYLNNQVLPVNFTMTDNFSLADKILTSTTYDGANLAGNNIDLSLEHLGAHSLKVAATDEADNVAEKTAEFTVATSLDAIKDNVKYYWDLKLIKKKFEKSYLDAQVKRLKKQFEILGKIEAMKISSKIKKLFIESEKRIINFKINIITKHLKQRSPEWINEKAAGLLIESLNYIRP